MIDEKMIDKIDVCREFFGVDDRAVCRYSAIFGMNGDIHMNKAISRNEAIQLVKRDCNAEKGGTSNIYISTNVIRAYSIRDFTGKEIFNLTDGRICGWLIQYDPTPFANWCHKCWYYLVVNEYCFEQVESNHGLCDSIAMEIVYKG